MENEFVVEKALCICQFGTAPATLEVPNQKKGHINGKKRTVTSRTLGSNVFSGCGFGTCNKNPSSPVPCKAVVTRWSEGFSKLSVCGGEPLVLSSKGSCAMGLPNCISILNSGQIPIPGTPQLKQATNEHQADLNPLGNGGLTAHQLNLQNGMSSSVDRKKEEDRVYQVQKIAISTLDEGSANNGTGTNTQEGMLHGKKYKLSVVQFKNDRQPVNLNEIRWEFAYHNDDTVIVGGFSKKGKEVVFHCDDTDYCGRIITFTAYIGDKSNGAQLKIFHHNRFRWFDGEIFKRNLEKRKRHPAFIDQHATSLCGVAALLYLYAKQYPKAFYDSFLLFFLTGKSRLNNLTLNPNEMVFEMKPQNTNQQYPHYSINNIMQEVDWVTLVGIRSTGNKSYTGKHGEDWDAINWPKYMTKTIKQLFNTTNVVDKTSFVTGLNFENYLRSVQKDFISGWKIIFLIDADMLADSVSYAGCLTQYHWIVYNGGLDISKDDYYSFSFFCWAKEYVNMKFSSKVFNSNFYGYIKFK